MKIQIAQISVKDMEYIGERHPCLNKGYRYTAVLIEGFTDEGTVLFVEFMNTGCSKIIYDSFVGFAEDWKIIGEYKFKECFLPIKVKGDDD